MTSLPPSVFCISKSTAGKHFPSGGTCWQRLQWWHEQGHCYLLSDERQFIGTQLKKNKDLNCGIPVARIGIGWRLRDVCTEFEFLCGMWEV